MTVEEAITTGIAELMHAAQVAVWRPTGQYQATERAIAIGDLPSSPSEAVALTVYGSADDPHYADSTVMLQALIRGTADPRSVDHVAAALADLIHGREGYDLGGVPIIESHRQSWSRMGQDGGGRWRRSDNYYLQAHTPTAHRTY